MALSGTFYRTFGSHYRLQGEWSATQNYENNTSTVTVKAYLIALNNNTINASSSNSGYINIEGGANSNFTATSGLSGYQKKHLHTHTRTITHNADGTFPDLDLTVSYDVNVTLSGTYYGTQTAVAQYALDTIPRESTLSSTPSWTAGNNFTISVNRSSSSFSHKAEIYVKNRDGTYGPAIKTVDMSSSVTSASSSFNNAEMTELYNKLDQRASADTRVILRTYNGSTYIGQSQKDGTVTTPAASHPTTGYTRDWYIDQEIYVPISRANPNYTHTVRIKVGSYTKTFTGVQDSITWFPSSAEQQSLYAQTPNSNKVDGTIEIDTFYYGEQIQYTTAYELDWYVRNSNPNFNATISYADVNTTTTNITGNNQYIISGHSSLRVSLPASSASAVNGASMDRLIASVAGETMNIPFTTAAVDFNFDTISATTNQTITVRAVDSRGNSTTISKIALVVPYHTPTLSTSAARVNGFEAATTLKSSGSIAPINVAGVAKNYVTTLRYRTREKGTTTWSAYTTIPRTDSGSNFTGTDQSVSFDITKAFEVEFSVTDRFDTTLQIKTVTVGRPMFFLDDSLSSIGFNDFPKDPNTFLVNGKLTFAGNLYASSGEGAVGGAIDLNNGDIVRANGIWFNDPSDTKTEGLLFPKTGTASGSTDSNAYNTFYIRSNVFYMDNTPFMEYYPGDASGHGIRIGAGGLTIIGGGESSSTVWANTPYSGASEEMVVANDGAVRVITNLSGSYSSRHEWIFDSDGILRAPVQKEKNNGNKVSVNTNAPRPSGTTATAVHGEMVMIQSMRIALTVYSSNNLGSATVYYPTAFDEVPLWVVTTAVNVNASLSNATAHTITASSCGVYVRPTTTIGGNYSTEVEVVVCGKKA